MKLYSIAVYALLSLLLLPNITLKAQAPCATDYPVEMENWLKAYKANNPNSTYKSSSLAPLYVPIVAQIVGNDAGIGYYRSDYLLAAICNLNVQFADVDMFFYLKDVRYIQSTNLYEHTGNYNGVMQSTKVPNALNMYFVQDPSGACGYYTGWVDIVAINKSCGAFDNTTIAHEVGHYMSLPHTFYGWEGRSQTDSPNSTDERVSGSNCNTAGDYFCDTPADFISNRWNCPYSDNKLDYAGDPYQVDGSLYMSYANDACQNYFSAEQKDAMRAYLQSNPRRTGHLGYTPSNFDSVGVSTLIFPPDTGNYEPPANYVELVWEAVEGAEFYSVLLTQGSNPNFYLYDTITRDTSIIVRRNIQPNFTYRWKVAAFHEANTCGGYTDFSTFRASAAVNFTAEVTVSPESCRRYDGEVNITAVGNGGPFTYKWSNGIDENQASGLAAGRYLVSVTSATNQEIVAYIDVPFSGDVDVEIETFGVSQNLLRAEVKGGLEPYTYQWSDNTTASGTQITGVGEYAVTVTDALNCTATNVFKYTGIESAISESTLKLFPNPVAQGTQINLQFTANKNEHYQIDLVDLSGKLIFKERRNMQQGLNTEQLNLSNLAKGIYIIKISGENIHLNRKLYIY